MAGNKAAALANLAMIDKSLAGKSKQKFSLVRSVRAKIQREGAEETLHWIKEKYPEKYIDIYRDVLRGELQTQLKITGDISGLGVVLTYSPIKKKETEDK